MADRADTERGDDCKRVTKSREQFQLEMDALMDAAMRACRQCASVGDIPGGAQALADWADADAARTVLSDLFPTEAELNGPH